MLSYKLDRRRSLTKQKEKKMKKFVLIAVACLALMSCQKKETITEKVDSTKVDTTVVVVDSSADTTKK